MDIGKISINYKIDDSILRLEKQKNTFNNNNRLDSAKIIKLNWIEKSDDVIEKTAQASE